MMAMFSLRDRAGRIAFSFYTRRAFRCLTAAAFAMAEVFLIPAYAVYAILSAYAGVLYGRDFHSAYLPFLFLFPAAQTAASGFFSCGKGGKPG